MNNIKKLKGSMQLAKMRFDADPSEANEQLLDLATEAWEDAVAAESNDIARPVDETQSTDLPEDTTKSSDASGEKTETQKIERVSADSTAPEEPSTIVESAAPTQPANEPEKKTEDQQPQQS